MINISADMVRLILTALTEGKFINVFSISLTTTELRLSFLSVLYMHLAYTPSSPAAPCNNED